MNVCQTHAGHMLQMLSWKTPAFISEEPTDVAVKMEVVEESVLEAPE